MYASKSPLLIASISCSVILIISCRRAATYKKSYRFESIQWLHDIKIYWKWNQSSKIYWYSFFSMTFYCQLYIPELWELVDNWWLGLLAGNAIQMSIHSTYPESKELGIAQYATEKDKKRNKISFDRIRHIFYSICFNKSTSYASKEFVNVHGRTKANRLPSGSLAMTVVLRSTTPFLSSVNELRHICKNEANKK